MSPVEKKCWGKCKAKTCETADHILAYCFMTLTHFPQNRRKKFTKVFFFSIDFGTTKQGYFVHVVQIEGHRTDAALTLTVYPLIKEYENSS